ncbi:putative Beta-1,6-glucan synthase [Gammaproteobacteria bacterium]
MEIPIRISPSLASSGRVGCVVLAFLMAVSLVLVLQGWRGEVRVLTEPDITRLDCVSYAHPGDLFEWGTKPPISAPQIESELAALAKITGCVRIYSTGDGQDMVVQVAAKFGLKVILGAWLSRDPDDNRDEIERVVTLANAYPQAVRTIVLGNETLLRREMSAGELIAIVRDAKTRTRVPITTAEIWSFWLRHPDLAQAVDLLTVHVLPYWDGEEIRNITDAMSFSVAVIGKVAAAYPGKPILIGEIGWPSTGRARGAVAPGILEQARFARGIAALAAEHGWAYNLIEGYDQPWKRRSEGTVGGAWGLLHADGTPKAPLAGPISPYPDALWHGLLAALLGGIGVGLICRRCRHPHGAVVACPTPWRAALAAPLLALLLVEQAEFSGHAVAHWHEPPLHLMAWLASAGIAWEMLQALAIGQRTIAMSTAALFASTLTPSYERRRDTGILFGGMLFALRFSAACLALGQVLDPRYRDFAVILLVLPVLAPLAFRREGRLGAEDYALGALLLFGAAGSLLLSGFTNTQALLWAGTLMLLALPLLLSYQGQRRR